VLSDFCTTGDGLVAALQILSVIVAEGRPVSEVCNKFDPFPQVLKNVRYGRHDPLASAAVQAAILDGEEKLGDSGRLLIRKSGTEPLIRVMGEGQDLGLVTDIVDGIIAEVSREAGA
jgi:phosphoglucosamine mutase